MHLVWPDERYLPSYVAALEWGWSPDNARPEAAIREQLAKIAQDPAAFLREMVDREGKGPPMTMPDGSTKPRIPGYRKWMWDGEFCGSIGMRWQPGTAELPPHVLGHIGYAVVPWRRREGHASRALSLLLEEIAPLGLPHVELTTEPENAASIRVIEANGGVMVARFAKPAAYGGVEALRFRIPLPA